MRLWGSVQCSVFVSPGRVPVGTVGIPVPSLCQLAASPSICGVWSSNHSRAQSAEHICPVGKALALLPLADSLVLITALPALGTKHTVAVRGLITTASRGTATEPAATRICRTWTYTPQGTMSHPDRPCLQLQFD
ncbi:hypothetical protein MHYP_G00295290 [Metynnis hypsauchen]